MSDAISEVKPYTISELISDYEEGCEYPLCRSRRSVEFGITLFWMGATAGMAFFVYREWKEGGQQLSRAALYDREWTVLEQGVGAAYGFATALTLYRGTLAEWRFQQLARDTKLETAYTFLVVDVANYLDDNPDHFRHLETEYCKFSLYADALAYRDRVAVDFGMDANVSFTLDE